MRVARYVAELELSEEQRYLVNYHTEYMLFINDELAVPFDASRYTDHRREDDDSKREDRIKKNVAKAINCLDPSDYKHKETYKRIMARNRPAEEPHHEFDLAATNDPDNQIATQPSPNLARARYSNDLTGDGRNLRLIDDEWLPLAAFSTFW